MPTTRSQSRNEPPDDAPAPAPAPALAPAPVRSLAQVTSLLGPEIHIHHRCSLVSPPPHLAPRLGFSYPLQVHSRQGGRGSRFCEWNCQECPFPICVSTPPPDYLDPTDREKYAEWIIAVCEVYKLDITDTLKTLCNYQHPDNIKLHEFRPEGSENAPDRWFTHVIAFFRARDEEGGTTNQIYPVDISYWLVQGRPVHSLRTVREPARRLAFSQLSEVIEDVAPSLNEGQLKRLYDAAKRAFES